MTAKVLHWPRHFMHGSWCHPDDGSSDACQACVLSLCLVCGGAEGDLTTECPGERTTPAQREAVMAGRLDFVLGDWVVFAPLKEESDRS